MPIVIFSSLAPPDDSRLDNAVNKTEFGIEDIECVIVSLDLAILKPEPASKIMSSVPLPAPPAVNLIFS